MSRCSCCSCAPSAAAPFERHALHGLGAGPRVLQQDECITRSAAASSCETMRPRQARRRRPRAVSLLVRGRTAGLRREHGLEIYELDDGERARVAVRGAKCAPALLRIWQVMQACVERGFHQTGVLPGVLKVRRRAPQAVSHADRETRPGARSSGLSMPWIGSMPGRWPSTRRTPPAAASSPRRPTARPASCPRCCITIVDSSQARTMTG